MTSGAWAQVSAASCGSATASGNQVRADGTQQVVVGGLFSTTVVNSPAFYAAHNGQIGVTGAATLVTTAPNTATACLASGSTLDFRAPGSVVSRTGAGGPAVRGEAGTTLISTGTSFYTAQANSDGIQLVNGRYEGQGDVIAVGVVLGTASSSAAFGLPVDSGGLATSDPAQWVSRAAGGSHGINASGGAVSINAGQPSGTAPLSSIYMFGTGASAANPSYGINAMAGSTVQANALRISARNNYNGGLRVGSASTLNGDGVRVDTAGIGAFGALAIDGGQIELHASNVRTLGSLAHGVLAQGAGWVSVADSDIVVAGTNAHALRAEGAGSRATATTSMLAARGNGGNAAAVASAGALTVTGSQLYSSGIAGGNAATALHVSGGGVLVADGNGIVTGAVLGSDPDADTFGRPVDASGTAVVDPRDLVAVGNSGAHGIAIAGTGGTAWVNVDPLTGQSTGRATRIDLLATASSGILVQQFAGAVSEVSAANVDVYARALNGMGFQIQGIAGATGPTADFDAISARTLGVNGHGLFARDGAQVDVQDSTFITGGGGAGIRADGGATRVDASRLYIATTGAGSNALNAIGATINASDSLLVTAGRHGMTLSASGGVTGTLIADAVDIVTGVLLGTDLYATTFGMPVDASGTAITDPAQFIASGHGGHGVFVATPGGNVWINVDPSTGAATGSTSRMHLFGPDSQGLDIQGLGSQATIANVQVVTEGVNGVGLRTNGGARIDATDVAITTSGLGAYGLASFEDGALRATNASIATSGAGALGLIAYNTNGTVHFGSGRISTTGEAAHGAVARRAGHVEVANSMISTTGEGSAGLFVFGETALATMDVRGSEVSSGAGPGVLGVGLGTLLLTDSTVTGNDLWLRVADPESEVGFPPPPPDLPEPPVTPDPPDQQVPVLEAAAPESAAVPSRLEIVATNSTLTGGALTEAASTSQLTLVDSVWHLTVNSNLTSLINDASLVNFSPPTGDAASLASYRTLTVGDYGGNGTLAMNVFLADDDAPSDRLRIDGGSARGGSTILVQRSGGAGAVTRGNGILLVDAFNGASTTADAFRLARRVIAGPYEYTLQRSSRDASGPQNWYLRSTVDCSGPGAPIPPCPAPPDPPVPPPDPPPPGPQPDPDPLPDYRSDVTLYAALAPTVLNYGRALLDSLHERVGEQEHLLGRDDIGDRDGALEGMWARLIYIDGERDGDKRGIYGRGPSYDYEFAAIQMGLDLHQSEQSGSHADRAGLYGAIGYALATAQDIAGASVGRENVDGYTLGGYWSRYGADGRPWYIDAVLQATWYDAQSHSNDASLPAMETDGTGITASIEAGYPFQLNETWRLEPQAQLDYSWLDLDDTSDLGGEVRFDDTDSLVGRISGRLSRQSTRDDGDIASESTTMWTRLSVRHEFRGEPVTRFASENGWVPFRADMDGTWWEIEAGLTHEVGRNVFFYGNLGYMQGWNDDRRAWEGKLGVRANW